MSVVHQDLGLLDQLSVAENRVGEVVGSTGLPGNGFEEVPDLLSGVRPATGGTIEVGSRSVKLAGIGVGVGVGAAIRAGIVLVPERRDRDGVAFELSIRDNICAAPFDVDAGEIGRRDPTSSL